MVAIPDGPQPAVGLYWYDDTDPTVPPGMPAPLSQLLIRTDTPAIYFKDGFGDEDWILIAGGGVVPPPNLHVQSFRVTRQAGDTDTIVVNAARGFLPRASVNFNVIGTMGKNSLGVGVQEIDPALFTLTQFTLVLTSAWGAGDSIMFVVEDLA